eukprot:tig00000215_g18541.t1
MRRAFLALVLLVAAAGWSRGDAQTTDFTVSPLSVQLEARGGRQMVRNVTVTNTGTADISRVYVLLDPAPLVLQRSPADFPLPVGASVTVSLTLTGGLEPLTQQVFVYFSKIDAPELRRLVQASIKVVVPSFSIEGLPAAFDLLPGTSASRVLAVSNTGTLAPLGLVARLSSSLASTLQLGVAPQSLTLGDGQAQNVTVSFAGTGDSLLRNGTLDVEFPGDGISPAVVRSFPVSVRVRGAEFFPASLFFNVTMNTRTNGALQVTNRQRTRPLKFSLGSSVCWIRGLNVTNQTVAPGATATVSFVVDNFCLGPGPVQVSTVILVTTDAEGSASVPLPATISVADGRPPIASATVEGASVYYATAPLRGLRLLGAASQGVDAPIVSYRWSQVNVFLTPVVDLFNATMPTARIGLLSEPGYYQFQLTVVDALNKTSSQIAVCVVSILVVQANLRLNNDFAPFDVSYRTNEGFRANFISRLSLVLRVARNALVNVLLSPGSVDVQMYVVPGPSDTPGSIVSRMGALTQPEIETGLGFIIQNKGFTSIRITNVSNPNSLQPAYPQGYVIEQKRQLTGGEIASIAISGGAVLLVVGGTLIMYRRYRKRRRKYRQMLLEQAARAESDPYGPGAAEYGAVGTPAQGMGEEVPGAFPRA